jgi:integrase
MRVRPKTWTDFKAELMALYEPPFRTKATRASMKTTIARIEAAGVTSTKDLTVGLVARVVGSMPPESAPRTVAGTLRRIRVMCNFAVNCGYLNVSPFTARPVRSWVRLGSPRVKNHHTREEIRRVLDLMATDTEQCQGWAQYRTRRLYALTTLFCFSGLRRNEGLYLHVQDLDLENRVVWVRDRQGNRLKTEAAAQPVPLPTAAIPPLRAWLEHRLDRPPGFVMPESVPWLFPNIGLSNAWSEGSPGTKPIDRLQAVARRAGVEGMTWHSLRRSLATALEGFGLSQPLITRCLRHSSEAITRTWYQGADLPALTHAVEGFHY